jgi:ketosteroid isomerase-like protein
MKVRRFFVFGALVLLAVNGAEAKGKYERTKDGKARVWNEDRQRHVSASWSGDTDDNGYATGRGTLTWYRAQRTWETGSLLPTTKYIPVSRFTGKMVDGKLEGSVVTVDAGGTTYHAKFADGQKKGDWIAGPAPSKRKPTIAEPKPESSIAAAKPEPAVESPAEAPPPAPKLDQHVTEKSAPAPSPKANQVVTEKSKENAPAQPTNEEAAAPASSLNALAMPPSSLRVASLNAASPQPAEATTSAPPTSNSANDDDARTVAALDTEYQAAVKTNDAATIDRILADDFVLVAGPGRSLSKSDVVKQARDKEATYEHHEIEEGTQKVRVWRDTAVLTGTLWVKGTEDGKPVDHKVSITDTYSRTPAGWRYVSGQASAPESK